MPPPASHMPTGLDQHPLPPEPMLLQPREVTHVLGNGNLHLPDSVPAVCSSQSSAHSNPHAGEGAKTLTPCWALGNNSANILTGLLNPFLFLSSFCTQLSSVSQRRHRAQPVPCQHSAHRPRGQLC